VSYHFYWFLITHCHLRAPDIIIYFIGYSADRHTQQIFVIFVAIVPCELYKKLVYGRRDTFSLRTVRCPASIGVRKKHYLLYLSK